MWSPDRRRLLLAALAASAALPGCGFAPAYGPGGGGGRLLNRVRVEAPEDRDDYLMTRALEERLGRAGSADYALRYTLDFRQERMAILADNTTARFNIVGRATYSLEDAADGTVLLSGDVESFTGYSATGTPVATRAAEADARERLVVILADQLVTRLLAAAGDLPR